MQLMSISRCRLGRRRTLNDREFAHLEAYVHVSQDSPESRFIARMGCPDERLHPLAYEKRKNSIPALWDGRAGERIADILLNWGPIGDKEWPMDPPALISSKNPCEPV